MVKQQLIDLETKFWQAMVDQDVDTATSLLSEPAVMVSSHGAMKFDRAAYRKMADQGPMVITDFEFSNMDVVFPNDSTAVLSYHVRQTMAGRGKTAKADQITQEVNDSSTWVKDGKGWLCVMHTETPAEPKLTRH
ncbi:MAG: nuclear transport factor 2 family protein [Pseudomonadota bacterium]